MHARPARNNFASERLVLAERHNGTSTGQLCSRGNFDNAMAYGLHVQDWFVSLTLFMHDYCSLVTFDE